MEDSPVTSKAAIFIENPKTGTTYAFSKEEVDTIDILLGSAMKNLMSEQKWEIADKFQRAITGVE